MKTSKWLRQISHIWVARERYTTVHGRSSQLWMQLRLEWDSNPQPLWHQSSALSTQVNLEQVNFVSFQLLHSGLDLEVILVPRGHDPLAQHQELWPLGRSNFRSNLLDLTLSLPRVTGSPWIKHFRCETFPEVVILGAGHTERGLWGWEWSRGLCVSIYFLQRNLISKHAKTAVFITKEANMCLCNLYHKSLKLPSCLTNVHHNNY